MKEAIKIILICVGCYTLSAVLAYITMGDITDEFRWDLLLMFWGGAIYASLTAKE